MYRSIRGISNTLRKQSRENFIIFTISTFISNLFIREESSYLDNDSCLPIYKMITAIFNTSHQTRAYGIPFFRTSSW